MDSLTGKTKCSSGQLAKHLSCPDKMSNKTDQHLSHVHTMCTSCAHVMYVMMYVTMCAARDVRRYVGHVVLTA